MKFFCLKHVFFEGPENIETWAVKNHHEFYTAHAFEHAFPDVGTFDVLVLMGGPMSANDDAILPWIKEEKKFIERAIQAGKKIIGVCLGAQLIASVLGAKVFKNPEREIGWFPVTQVGHDQENRLFEKLPFTFPVFHWHGETFTLPKNSRHLLKSPGCDNQAFLYGKNILGLQFHMEGTQESLIQMMENSRNEMTPGKYVQDELTLRNLTTENICQTEVYFYQLMDNFFGISG